MNSLFIDFGSTWIKYAVYCVETGEYLQKGAEPFPKRIPNPNPDIFEVTIPPIIKALEKILNDAKTVSIDKILISVQMHGYILKGDGLDTNYISWRDHRAATFDYSGIDRDYTALGTSKKVNLPLISMKSSGISDDTRCTFYTLGSYIAWYLTGNNMTHITDCAASGFFSVDTCSRGVEDFKNMQLPKASGDVVAVGEWQGAGVYTPVGDHQLSFLGTGIEMDEYLLNVSTGTQISTLSKQLKPDYECRPFFNEYRLCTVSGLIGGSYIAENQTGLEDALTENYKSALTLLPKKARIKVSGGAVQHFGELMDTVCKRLDTEYVLIKDVPIFGGFEKLLSEVIK